MPALRLTCAPIIVPVPISIHSSPYRAPVGKPISDPMPNAPNGLAGRVLAVITPARAPRPTGRARRAQATRRRYRQSALPRHGRERYRSVAASWPQAAAISRPRVSRTVQGTPAAATRRTNSCSAGLGRGVPLAAGRRVQRDHVHVDQRAERAVQQAAEQVGPPRLVVHVPDECVLDRYPAPGAVGVLASGAEHLGHLPPGVHRHKLVAQLVVGGMQGHGQRHGKTFVRQPAYGGHQPNRGDGDRALRDAETARAPDRRSGAPRPTVRR